MDTLVVALVVLSTASLLLGAVLIPVLRRVIVKTRWETQWSGHNVCVENWNNLLGREGNIVLYIDGEPAPQDEPGLPRSVENLYAEVRVDGRVQSVQVLLSNNIALLSVGEVPVTTMPMVHRATSWNPVALRDQGMDQNP